MTNNRALEFAKQECAAYKRKIENGYVYYQNIVDYYEIVIDALEKQIPKKPIAREHDELRGEILFHCPTCDDDFNCNEYEDSHCAECGQAIDWSDEEW